jgi:hypothetical protein
MRNRVPSQRSRAIEAGKIILASQNFHRVNLIEVEVLRCPSLNKIPATASKTRDSYALGHVFPIVPFVKISLLFWHNVVPDPDERLSSQAAHERSSSLRI